jgi:hypothetical protein
MSNNTISEQGIKMEMEEAFDQIVMRLQAASGRGVKPQIRVSGDDWVCTIEQLNDKFIIIAKEEELLLVHMELQNEPDIDRAVGEDYNQQDAIDRIREAITTAYGAPVQ